MQVSRWDQRKVKCHATKGLIAVWSTTGWVPGQTLLSVPNTRCQASFPQPQFPALSVYWLCSVLDGPVPSMPTAL